MLVYQRIPQNNPQIGITQNLQFKSSNWADSEEDRIRTTVYLVLWKWKLK